MRKYLSVALAVLVVMIAAACSNTPTRTGAPAPTETGAIPRMPDGKPDIFGVWIQRRGVNADQGEAPDESSPNHLYRVFTKEPLPMTPWAIERCNQLPLNAQGATARIDWPQQ